MSGSRTCPSCRAPLPDDAVLCVACGYHFPSGKRLKPRSREADRHWITGREMGAQAAYFVGLILGLGAALLLDLPPAGRVALAVAVAGAFIVLGVGTFVRVSLKRDAEGVCRLTKKRWIAFLPCRGVTVDLRRYDAVYVDCRVGDAPTWQTLLFRESAALDVYLLELGGKRVRQPLPIYRGWSETTMKDMVDALQELAGLRVERK